MYNRILFPIDLAHESSWHKAAPVAARLAQAFGAELHVLTVLPDVSNGMIAPYLPADWAETSVRSARKDLETLAVRALPETKPAGLHVVTAGAIYEAILTAADRFSCDLIVMASHRPELSDYLIGPNASRVVRHAPCSVHVVRS